MLKSCSERIFLLPIYDPANAILTVLWARSSAILELAGNSLTHNIFTSYYSYHKNPASLQEAETPPRFSINLCE